MNCENRRLLGMKISQENLEFALWRHELGSFLNKSGRLQKLNQNLNIEFADNIQNDFVVGVEVIGMEPGLPFENLSYFDYGPEKWQRFELDTELIENISELKLCFENILKNVKSSFTRVRFIQNYTSENNEIYIGQFIDLIQ